MRMIDLSAYDYKGFQIVKGRNKFQVTILGSLHTFATLDDAMWAIDQLEAIKPRSKGD
jgi:hypothetical protein